MIARLSAAITMPGVECLGSSPPVNARTASVVTNAARAKKETAMIRRVRCSRRSGSLAENCQDNANAELTSMTESRPKPIRAEESAAPPAQSATTASMRL
ncbi:hypothetical protein D9M72_534350 [compost metagenome]